MPHPLINHSPDLKKLWDEGFAIEIKGAHLLVHDVPYVNSRQEIMMGTLVSTLMLATSEATAPPDTHVIFFIGEHPCNKDGSIISGIQHGSQNQDLGNGIIINHSFSNKPNPTYPNYYDKVVRYCDIISAPAKSLDQSVTERTFNVSEPEEENSVFQYMDTNSSRAKIGKISEKLTGQKIAIIGLGGTGSYILDLVAKSPVAEIHLFDGDYFLVHNAFRCPGAPSAAKLRERLKKVENLKEIYSNMHRNIIAHDDFITKQNVTELSGKDFVFLSMDKGTGKKCIVSYLEEQGIPFIDVGIGIHVAEDSLIGIVSTTTSTNEKRDHVINRVSFTEGGQNEYTTNIQIAELNSLNAALAVIKWKKHIGFYQDLEKEHFTAYTLNTGDLLNEDNLKIDEDYRA